MLGNSNQRKQKTDKPRPKIIVIVDCFHFSIKCTCNQISFCADRFRRQNLCGGKDPKHSIFVRLSSVFCTQVRNHNFPLINQFHANIDHTPQIFSSAFIVAKRQIAFFKRSHIRCQSKWFTAGHH